MTESVKSEIVDGNENDFLEMSNHFKKVLDRKDSLLKSIKKKYMDQKKSMARVYGLISELIDYMEDSMGVDYGGDILMEFMSHSIKGVCEDNLFKSEIIDIYLEID